MRWRLIVVYVFSVLAVAFLSMALFPGTLTSFATSETVGSNVSVENFFAIDISTNLNSGITFDEVKGAAAKEVMEATGVSRATYFRLKKAA